MAYRSRLLLALAALALLAVYVLPLWHIKLEAPQYPEGLGMYIRINTVEGQHQGNLQSINALNHYIGMKPIEPHAIPELKILPWVFCFLIVTGMAAAALGRRWMLYGWATLLGLIMTLSLVDFYRWGYDYGHNLDHERAIIKVPGMSYQPPVIGTKKMLNITAHSWPAAGGWIAALSFALGAGLVVAEARRPAPSSPRGGTSKRRRPGPAARSAQAPVAILVLAASALALSASGCTPEPRPIRYGQESCAHCRMTVSDPRYGAQLVTTTGKTYVFDSIECLTATYEADEDLRERIHSLWVTDYRNPPRLLDAAVAAFVHSPQLHSPMGGQLAAFDPADADGAQAEFEGRLLAWPDVLDQPAGHALPARPAAEGGSIP